VRAGGVLIATGTTFQSSATATGTAGVFLGDGALSITGTTGAVVVAAADLALEVVVSTSTTSGGVAQFTANVRRGTLPCETNKHAPVNI
jgi:hypothetical protein